MCRQSFIDSSNMTMQPTARATLLELVKERISGLIRDSVTVQRHSKRARLHETATSSADEEQQRPMMVRSRLHAADINVALQLAGSEKLYASAVVPPGDDMQDDASTTKVSLADFLRNSSMPAPPSEIGYHMRWLTVDGVSPDKPPQQPKQQQRSGASKRTALERLDNTVDNSSNLRVHQLRSSLLSQELQLYFSRVTTAIERGGATAAARQDQDTALAAVARDPGLQELVPFFVRYCQQELYQSIGRTEDLQHSRTLVRLARALLDNQQVHLELHLHELLPALMTCVVVNHDTKQSSDHHWALRREAAHALLRACDMFGEEYATLKARVLRALCDAVMRDPAGSDASGVLSSLPSRYGGTVAISLFGSRAVDAFLLPSIISAWNEWEAALGDPALSAVTKMEIQMCQRASLDALSVFLGHVSPAEKAARLDRQDLEELLGDRIIALEGEANEYATCFV